MRFFTRLFRRRERMPLPELTSGSEEDWLDCGFAVEEDRRARKGRRILRAAARHAGERVALEAELGSSWEALEFGEGSPFTGFRGEVLLHRPGAEGDALVRALDQLYDTGVGARAMATSIRFTAITLEGDPRAPDRTPVRIKLFYEPAGVTEEESDDWYAEAYLNLDLAARRLWLAEKDPDYRAPLVRALSGILPPNDRGV